MLKKLYDWFNRRNERKVVVAKLGHEYWAGECMSCTFYVEGSEAQIFQETTSHCLTTGHVVRGSKL